MKIEIYSRPGCTFCDRTKNFLNSRLLQFDEHVIDKTISRDEVIRLFPGAMTLPICVVEGVWIGGYSELSKMILENEVGDGKKKEA